MASKEKVCMNCKHWKNNRGKATGNTESPCNKIEEYVSDYGTESAGIWTKGNFGCIRFTSK